MRGITWLGCLISLALAVAACDAGPAEQVLGACSVFCSCEEAPLPSVQEACVTECVQNLAGGPFPQPCLDCISGHANRCASIERDCEPLCELDEPVEDPIDDPPPPPIGVDAGL